MSVKPISGLLLAATLGALAACTSEESPALAAGSRGASPTAAVAVPFSTHEPVPAGAGETRLDLYTHCGVTDAEVESVYWLAEPPLGNGSPPEGWGYLTTSGRWKQTSETTAVFTADSGVTAGFVRAERPEALSGCA